jgi:hypothetical protein
MSDGNLAQQEPLRNEAGAEGQASNHLHLVGERAVAAPLPTTLRSRSVDGAAMVSGMLGVLLIPAVLTLRTVRHPVMLQSTSDNPTPLGYTWSLSLWLVPALAILLWLHHHRDYQIPRRAFWWTVGPLTLLGTGLDLLLGNTFFVFPNKGAVLGIYVWGLELSTGQWVKDLPIEEFIFYLSGFVVALLLYLWSDIFWFGRYVREKDLCHQCQRPRVKLHWPSALLGLGLVGAAILFKKLGPVSHEGFPGYFTFLMFASFIPSSLLFDSVRRLINWQAFSFTAIVMLFLSMMWEATVAIPYGWWGYKPEMMLGIFIGAWSGLPLEAPLVWVLVSYTTIIIYEAVHQWVASRSPTTGGEA